MKQTFTVMQNFIAGYRKIKNIRKRTADPALKGFVVTSLLAF